MSEAYSYITYKERIIATKDFVTAILDYMTENAEAIDKLLDAVDRELIQAAKSAPSRVTISLNAKAVAFDEKFTVKGYKDGQPHDYECDFIGKYESTKSTSLPYAYVIPNKMTRLVDRLLMHGVTVEKATANQDLKIEFDTVKGLDRAERAFQKHKMVRVETVRDSDVDGGRG